MLMKTKTEAIDFHAVEPHQREMDARLSNWAAWCNGGWGGPETSPMFRMVPPPPRVRGEIAYSVQVVDKVDAAKIAKAVFQLPEKNRKAVHWSYIRPVSPAKKCRDLGTTMEGLYQFLRDGRQMLINRAV
jgi:DNA-directed RNA polymerase specialized sigma24 family protein